jgi:hypothetical protein
LAFCVVVKFPWNDGIWSVVVDTWFKLLIY